MKTDQSWRLLFGTFLTSILIAWVWSTARTDLCELAVQTAVLEQKPMASCVEFWLNRYQTLATGGLALLGAFLTVGGIRRQIDQVDRLEEQRRQSESYAARAVLPLALSAICEYAKECIRQLKRFDPEDGDSANFEPPQLPINLMEPLRECVRFSDRIRARQIADLLNWVQVQGSRLHSIQPDHADRDVIEVVTGHSVDQAILDAAELYAKASKLFDYGRRSEEGPLSRLSVDEIQSALRVCRVWEEDRPSLYEWLEIRGKAQADPPTRSPK